LPHVAHRSLHPLSSTLSTVGEGTSKAREESAEGSSVSAEQASGCHKALRCLIFAGLWLGFLAALALTMVGVWTRCRNCLTVGVILAIVCLGVAIHNCLRRGEALPSIPIYLEGDSHLSLDCEAFEVSKSEEEVAEVETRADREMEGEGTSKCSSLNGGVLTPSRTATTNQEGNGDVIRRDEARKSGRATLDVEAGLTHILRPRRHRESAFSGLTRAIITTLTRAGRGGGGGGGSGGFHHAPRNAWNSNFEGHIGWQSALARPDPFYSTAYYR
uniref:Conserved plasma membrane protein n=1 Tax=Taenia asiatica TaxID=60517 RepID=A0A0R3W875_TAEAS